MKTYAERLWEEGQRYADAWDRAEDARLEREREEEGPGDCHHLDYPVLRREDEDPPKMPDGSDTHGKTCEACGMLFCCWCGEAVGRVRMARGEDECHFCEGQY